MAPQQQKPVVFTADAAKLIADTVRAVLRSTKPRTEDRHPYSSTMPTVVTDTENYSSGNPGHPGRMTIARNPENPALTGYKNHRGEYQLRNVQNVLEASFSVPFFSADYLSSNQVVGELYWAQIDSKRYGGGPYAAEARYKSLDITNDFSDTTKGKWNLGLYGFVASASCSAPYSIHDGVPNKTLTWQVPVAIGGDPYPFPGVPGTVTYVSSAFATATTGSYASIKMNTKTASVEKGTINFGTSETPGDEVKADVILDASEVNSAAKHDSLSDTEASAKHDGRFLHRVGRSTDKYGAGGYNQCESIANDTAGKNGISFASGILYDAATASSVNYASRILYDSAAKASVDWQNRTLKDSSETITADWNGKGLVGRWTLGATTAGGALVSINDASTSSFQVVLPGVGAKDNIKAYDDSGPRTEIRGLRLYARDSASVYFDLEVSDGVLVVRDHTGVNCGEFRRTL